VIGGAAALQVEELRFETRRSRRSKGKTDRQNV